VGYDLAGSLEEAKAQHAEGCVKTAVDLARYRAVIERYLPDHIVEVGTFSGKSAVWFAQNAGCPVTSIDVNHRWIDRATWRQAGPLDVLFVLGRSTDPRTVEELQARWRRHGQPERPMVVLDGDHSGPTVLAELNIYAPMVPPGGYVVAEDTLVRWMPWEQQPAGPYIGSPLDAVEEWLAANPEWAVDEEIDGMHPTGQFPRGWLRRRP